MDGNNEMDTQDKKTINELRYEAYAVEYSETISLTKLKVLWR